MSVRRESSTFAGRARPPGTRKEDWIADQLRRVYDGALEDSIPAEMLDLLNALDDEDERQRPGEGDRE